MSKLTTQEIFDLRKAIIEKFGVKESDGIWFKYLLPALTLQELIEKRQKEFFQSYDKTNSMQDLKISSVLLKLLEDSKK